ncbi:MAG: hypothetical protein JXR25_01010 [Pontiellaceae bacterium]|nr:hypothetical protein [Pontiellaceae bacterium]MBN2783378.1 hypothetical protein [Pontiellaceae bacterium]
MAYCSKCGVEVDLERATCPLCNVPIHRYEEETELSPLWPIQRELPAIKKRTKRFIALLPALIILLVAFLVILIVAPRMEGSQLWSRYALTTLGALFSVCTGIIVLGDTKIITLGWITASVLAMLWFFDGFDEGVWFTPVGLPITLIIALYGKLSLIAAELWGKRYGIQAMVQALFITLLCLSLDGIISAYRDTGALSWSLIAAAPLMVLFAVAALCSLVLNRFIDFEKFLHR